MDALTFMSLSFLFVAVDDSATSQVVSRKLYNHAILWEDTDVVLSHFSRDVCKDKMSIGQFNSEHCVRKSLFDRAFDLDYAVFIGHTHFTTLSATNMKTKVNKA